MIDISAYYRDDLDCLRDDENDRIVNCAGHYLLVRQPEFSTFRPEGREDYQLMYVNGGCTHILEGQTWVAAGEGTAILFEPGAPQIYRHLLEDKPDIYWVHFTGRRAGELVRDRGFSGGLYQVGCHGSYISCFDKIIGELQLKHGGFMELCGLYLEELFCLMRRHLEEEMQVGFARGESIEAAIRYFHENYQRDIVIKDYARECGMSLCWFIRCFRGYTGVTPQKYIAGLRLNRAKELLEGHGYPVGEVARLVGYSNPLYFSRIFKQFTGYPPSGYAGRNRYHMESPARRQDFEPGADEGERL